MYGLTVLQHAINKKERFGIEIWEVNIDDLYLWMLPLGYYKHDWFIVSIKWFWIRNIQWKLCISGLVTSWLIIIQWIPKAEYTQCIYSVLFVWQQSH